MNDELENSKYPNRTDLLWQNQCKKVVYPTANYTVGPGDDIIVCNTSITVTLPLAARGREIYVNKNYAAGSPVTVARTGSINLIAGGTSTTVATDFTTKHFKAVKDGYILL